MKQYTDQSQTAKLMELGFADPKSVAKITYVERYCCGYESAYSIGELIEMLGGVSELEITRYGSGWGVYDELRAFTCEELIDALYDMIIMLKEEGVI